MKKIYALATLAFAALAAQAQYATTPYLQPIAENAENSVFDVLILSDDCQGRLKSAGKTVNYLGPDDVNRNLYIWDGTFNGGDGSYPGVGYDEENPNFEGYCALSVANVGWSGGGYNLKEDGYANLSHLNASTHFHVAYRSTNAPVSIGFIILDGKAVCSVGDPFNDNGKIYPAIGPKATDEWQAVDITLGDLAKLNPEFDIEKTVSAQWTGNLVSFLAGGVEGTNMSLDAMYFYSSANNAVEGVEADAVIVFTGRSINAAGAKSINLYNMQGQLVKSSNSSVLGVEGLEGGLYIAKAGKSTAKIFVK